MRNTDNHAPKKGRRTMGRTPWLVAVIVTGMLAPRDAGAEGEVLDIASRRELFLDHFLIDRLDGTSLTLHHPQPAGVAIRFDQPWEGGGSSYFTVLEDGSTYRLYYRGSGMDGGPQVTCYAESPDGKRWTKPKLGLHRVQGTRDNNVILTPEVAGPATHNFCPFLDAKPGVPASERYKAVGGSSDGLIPFASGDGLHWRRIRERPVITRGAFDSQNVAFWSATENQYVCYFRTWKRVGDARYRWISRATSPDFLNWSEPIAMTCGATPPEHLYTNATQPYFRAPHISIALPRRFLPGRRVLTASQVHALGLEKPDWLKNGCSEGVFMTSRGGTRYDRTFLEAFIRPGPGPRHWVARSNTPALGVVPTGPAEMSLYVGRHRGQASHYLERLTLRTDGFISVRAGYAGGEMVTRPLRFSGRQLFVNVATSAAGGIRVAVQTADGKAIEGYTFNDCQEIIGDEIERVVVWTLGTSVAKLAGQPVRLRFRMKDADLYALRFQ